MVCKRPTNSLFINSNGGLRPDPRYDSDIDYIDNYDSLAEYLNSDKLKTIQQNFYKETDVNCLDCIKTTSQSSFTAMDTKNDQLTTLFLGISNLCNFECRMCGSYASDKLIPRDLLLQNTKFQTQYSADLKTKGLTQSQLDKLLSNLDVFSSLQTIKINGGEPFLEDNNFLILEKLIPFSKNINVSIITNASIFPNKRQFEILSNYKHVRISVGLESTSKCYEYIRNNSCWKTVEENIYKFSQIFTTHFFVSLTAMSIFEMDDLIEFIGDNKVDFQSVTRPDYLSHEIFGNLLYDIYPKSLHHYVINKDPDHQKISKFLSYINFLDKYYKSSLLDIQPKFRRFYD